MANILVVDDEAGIRRALKRLVESRGWTVAEADSGAAALEVVARGGVDAIICDVMMPGGSGLSFYDEAVKRHPDLARRIIFLTAAAKEPEIHEKVEERGAPLLSKLYGLDLVVDALRIALIDRGGA